LQLQLPTLSVRLGHQHVACQTFVASQCRGLVASAVLTSPTSLSPIAELGMAVEFRGARSGESVEVTAPLTSSQLAARQALVVAVAPKLTRRAGEWTATWRVGGQVLAAQRIRAVSQFVFRSSLRVVDTRFIVESDKGETKLCRQLPKSGDTVRAGPGFIIASREPGMAGLVKLQVRAQSSGSGPPPLLPEQTVLVTDGPTLFTAGLLDAKQLADVTIFELRVRDSVLGSLSLCPTPMANFTTEGGFETPSDFAWTPTAEDELTERLSKLMDGPRE